MSGFVDPKKYHKFKKWIFEHSLAFQEYEGCLQKRPLTDAEMAEELDLTEEEVRNIRCMAEIELTPWELWFEAQEMQMRPRSPKQGGGKSE